MTITEKTTKANTPRDSTPGSGWHTFDEPDSCWRTITHRRENRYSLTPVCCQRLDCHECGPRKRQADYEKAVARHAMEDEIWVVYVRAEQVDRLRKIAGRAEQPIAALPVADDWNAVISPFHFEGASQLSSVDMEELFMEHRIGRRKFRPTGRWENKSSPEPDDVDAQTISREYVSPEAFKVVAQELGAKVHHSGRDSLYFDDMKWSDPNQVRIMFLRAESKLREERHRRRGWRFWGGEWIRCQPTTEPQSR